MGGRRNAEQGSFPIQDPSQDSESFIIIPRLGLTQPTHSCLSSPITHLPKGVSQFLYTDHICRLRQEFRAHQFHKVIKIHMPTHCGAKRRD